MKHQFVILTFLLVALTSMGQTQSPSAFANVFIPALLPPQLRMCYPANAPDFIQAFVFGEPLGTTLRIDVAYQYDDDTLVHSEIHLAGDDGTLMIINVPDGLLAKPLAIRVNGSVLWGTWPTVAVPRVRVKSRQA